MLRPARAKVIAAALVAMGVLAYAFTRETPGERYERSLAEEERLHLERERERESFELKEQKRQEREQAEQELAISRRAAVRVEASARREHCNASGTTEHSPDTGTPPEASADNCGSEARPTRRRCSALPSSALRASLLVVVFFLVIALTHAPGRDQRCRGFLSSAIQPSTVRRRSAAA